MGINFSTPPEIGSRVGLIWRSFLGIAQFLGYGWYIGDEKIPEDIPGKCAEEMRIKQLPCAKFKLDSGDIVWGCECYWSSEDSIQDRLKKYDDWERVDISEVRGE